MTWKMEKKKSCKLFSGSTVFHEGKNVHLPINCAAYLVYLE